MVPTPHHRQWCLSPPEWHALHRPSPQPQLTILAPDWLHSVQLKPIQAAVFEAAVPVVEWRVIIRLQSQPRSVEPRGAPLLPRWPTQWTLQFTATSWDLEMDFRQK